MTWFDTYQQWLTEEQSLSNAQLVVNYYKAKGWAKESIAALCGNMRKESSLNPNMSEYGYAWEADRGYGLVQWTPRSKYWNWAVGQGLPPEVAESQLARIDYEQANNIQWGPKVYGTPPYDFHGFAVNQNNDSVDTLTYYFGAYYEAPAALSSSIAERRAFAHRVFNELDWTGAGTGVQFPAYPVLPGTPITSPYSTRINPVTGLPENHLGTDWGGASGDPIFAIMAGVVVVAASDSVMGNYVIIKHTLDGKYSRYQHLSAYSVSTGQTVTKGSQIATMGTTGESTGVHLHMTVSDSQWAGYMDPEIYLGTALPGGDTGQQPLPNGNIPTHTEQTYTSQKTGGQEMIYQVKSGDTLSAIASKYGVNINDIMTVHYIYNKDLIDPGMKLYIPVDSKTALNAVYGKQNVSELKHHIVKSGDTLGAIAARYNMTVNKLLTFNPAIKDPNRIYVGQKITITGGN